MKSRVNKTKEGMNTCAMLLSDAKKAKITPHL